MHVPFVDRHPGHGTDCDEKGRRAAFRLEDALGPRLAGLSAEDERLPDCLQESGVRRLRTPV
jgi:hypothetical protein